MSLLLALAICFGSLVDRAYLQQDDELLRELYVNAPTRYDSLLVLYRLYPLTEDRRLLEDLPEVFESESASELAIFSALWAFRIKGSGPLKLISYGRKSVGFLERAIQIDPDDPYVLLSEGQSLYYRPDWAGGSKRASLDRFDRLKNQVDGETCGLSVMEVDMWRWLALSKLDRASAEALRASILSRGPPPLVHQFVTGPPP